MAKKRILLTGSAGAVGTIFRNYAEKKYDIVCFDCRPTKGVRRAIVANLLDLGALRRAARGCDAVVHLAAFPRPANFLETIVPNNIIGAYNAYEAAVRENVRKFVFASSVHAEFGHGEEAQVTPWMRPAPTNVYGASKILGENLGRIFSRRHGLSVICLRFGAVLTPRDAGWMERYDMLPTPIALLPKDLCEIIRRSIEVKNVDFAILPAFSNNARRIRDLSLLKKVLGYEPREDAYEKWGAGRIE